MKQEHQRIREIVKELGEKQFNDHTRPIRYTKGYDNILEYIEQQENADSQRALTDTTLEIVKRKREEAMQGREFAVEIGDISLIRYANEKIQMLDEIIAEAEAAK